jgi:hypothetical protein
MATKAKATKQAAVVGEFEVNDANSSIWVRPPSHVTGWQATKVWCHRVLAAVYAAGPLKSSKWKVFPAVFEMDGYVLWETTHGTVAELVEAQERLTAAAEAVAGQ